MRWAIEFLKLVELSSDSYSPTFLATHLYIIFPPFSSLENLSPNVSVLNSLKANEISLSAVIINVEFITNRIKKN